MQAERRSFTPAYERAQATVEGQHAGVLCQMGADEKTRAVRSCSETSELAPMLNMSLVAAARGQSIHAKPVRSLGQLLNKIPVADLRAALQGFGAQGMLASTLKKKDMVAFLSHAISSKDIGYMDFICSMGSSFLKGVRRIVEAGGSVDVPAGEVRSTDQLVMPRFPIVFLTDWNDVFTNVVPEELCKLLANADWEEAEHNAARVDEAMGHLDLQVDFYGIVPFDDAVESYRKKASEPLSSAILRSAIALGATGTHTHFELYEVDGTLCLVHEELLWFLDEGDAYEDYAPAGEDELKDLLELQGEYAARPITEEMLGAGSVEEWVARCDVAQEFMAYLDAHLPDETNECLAADIVLCDLIPWGRQGEALMGLMPTLRKYGFVLGDDQLDYVVGLFSAVMARVPQWELNGWSRLEVVCGQAMKARRENDLPDVIPFGPRAGDATSREGGTQSGDGEVLEFPRRDGGSVADDDSDADELVGDSQGSGEFDYEAYELRCKELKEQNEGYLTEFEEWLTASGLKPQTVQRHIGNVDFFINHYLHYSDAYSIQEGTQRLDDFLGYWFIRKAMWSSPATVQQTAASLKKFYSCMAQKGHVSQEALAEVLETIKEGLPEWKEASRRFDDGDPDWWE